eukprot:g61563.t1
MSPRRSLHSATLAKQDAVRSRIVHARDALEHGIAEADRRHSVSYKKAEYWFAKYEGAHPGLHGGWRYQTLTPEAQICFGIRFSSCGKQTGF